MKQEKTTKDNVINFGGSKEAGERNEELQKQEQSKKRLVGIGVLVCLVIAAVIYMFGRSWEYKGYKVVDCNQTDYANTANYIQFSDNLLKYTPDGVSYINKKGETVWTTGINMKIPVAVSSGDYAVVADQNGNTVCVFNAEGEVSSQTMPYPISDVDVGDQGVFCVVLESEKTNYINLYNRKGEIIYEIQASIDKSGYPLDISVSNNGEKLFTSYMKVGSSAMESNLIAYNFGEVGQNSNADRIVGTYTFDDEVFPKVQYINNDMIAAFGTKTIELYAMKEKPSLKKRILLDDEIRSVFYGEDYIGIVQKNKEGTAHLYTISAFNSKGKKIFQKEIDFDYDNIFASDTEIILSGGKNCIIFRKNGSVKFQGTLESRIRSVVPTGNKREYIVVYENETQIIRLKYTSSNTNREENREDLKTDEPEDATGGNAATATDAEEVK